LAVPNLPLHSPVPQDPSLTAAGHRWTSSSSEPRRPKPPPLPHRCLTASMSSSIYLLARRLPRTTLLLAGRTPRRHDHRRVVGEHAGPTWLPHPRGVGGMGRLARIFPLGRSHGPNSIPLLFMHLLIFRILFLI
jgi:hypothetical protein